jgi:hypothetical protein
MTGKWAAWTPTVVACACLAASVACNCQLLAVPSPTPQPSATPSPSPSPSPTPLPDPLAVLDSYPSLATVRQRLDDMLVVTGPGDETKTGRELLGWIFDAQRYDPTANNAVKEQVFAPLDDYRFPHVGARIYLISVATGLWTEAQGLVPWSLADYSVEEINNIFIENEATDYMPDPALHRGDLPPDMPNVYAHSHPEPSVIVEGAHYKQFNLAHRLAGGAATQEEAAAQLVVWMQQNFFHAIAPDYTWDVYLDGREPLQRGGPHAYPTTIERIYEERVSGCHEPTILLEGMLHSLNVPAVRLMVHGHGVLYLPTLDRYVHGDHVVGATDAPPGILLLTPDEFRPFAEDEDWIYHIRINKWQSAFISMPLYREGEYLYIHARGVVQGACIEVSEEEWDRITRQLSAYNLQRDEGQCDVTSDMVRIRTLDELNDED